MATVTATHWVHRLLQVLVLVAMVAQVTNRDLFEVLPEDLEDSWRSLGDLEPTDPKVHVGDHLNMTCSVRRKILRKYNLTAAAIGFKFQLYYGKNKSPEIRVNDTYIKWSPSRKTRKRVNSSQMSYPIKSLDYDEAFVYCTLKVNNTHEMIVDDTMMNVGFVPAMGHIKNVETTDFVNLKITFDKTHRNPIYVTYFTVFVRINNDMDPTAKFYACSGDYGKNISNDTCLFFMSKITSARSRNSLIEVYVQSYNLNGLDRMTVKGPIKTFRLYAQYKPRKVSKLNIQYEKQQWALARWSYPSVPVPLKFSISYQSHLDLEPKYIYKSIGYYHEEPIEANLTGLRWGVTYNIVLYSKPEVGGFQSEALLTTLPTAENVPAENPHIVPGCYERIVTSTEGGHATEQDIVIYWEPVPVDKTNGNISSLQVKVFNGSSFWQHPVPTATQRSDVIRGLNPGTEYRLWVTAATEVGINDDLPTAVMLEVPRLQDSLFDHLPQNFTVIAQGDSEPRDRNVSVSWDPRFIPFDAEVMFHWCVGKQKNTGKCDLLEPHHWLTFDKEVQGITLNLDHEFSHYVFGISVRTKHSMQTEHSSSGIHWSSCTYDITKGAPPPGDSGTHSTTTSTVTLTLTHPACTQQGYIYAYQVIVEEHREEMPPDPCGTSDSAYFVQSRLFTNTSRSSFTIEDLNHDTEYMFLVYSMTRHGRSHSCLSLTLRTERKRVEVIAGVAACLAILMLMVVILGVKFRKRLKEKILITEPEIPEIEAAKVEAASRQSPDGGYSDISNSSDPLDGDDKCLLRDDPDVRKDKQIPFLSEQLHLLPPGGVQLALLSLDPKSVIMTPKLMLDTSMAESEIDNGDCQDSRDQVSVERELTSHSIEPTLRAPPALKHQIMMPLAHDSNGDGTGDDGSTLTPSGSSENFQVADIHSPTPMEPPSNTGGVYSNSNHSDIEPYPRIEVGSSNSQNESISRQGCPSQENPMEKAAVSDEKDRLKCSSVGNHDIAELSVNTGVDDLGQKGSDWTLPSTDCVLPRPSLQMTLSTLSSQDSYEDSGESLEHEEDNSDGDKGSGGFYCKGEEIPMMQYQESDDSYPEEPKLPMAALQRPDSGFYSPQSSPAVHVSTEAPVLTLLDTDDTSICSMEAEVEDDDQPDEGIMSLTEQSSVGDDGYCPGIIQNGVAPAPEKGYSPGRHVDTTQQDPMKLSLDWPVQPYDSSDPYKTGFVIHQ